MSRVVIVGAGISGLALAFRLQKTIPAAQIVVLEQSDRPGGMVWTERAEGFQFELGPNGFLNNVRSTWQLATDLGLAEELAPASAASAANRYIHLENRLRRLPTGLLEFVTSDLLSWRGKLALAAEPFRRRRPPDPDESVHALVRRRLGREAAEVLADAMVTGIYAGDPTLLSARSAFPRLTALERDYGSIIAGLLRAPRTPACPPRGMWSFRGGMRILIEALVRQLATPPCFGVSVTRLEERPAGQAGWPWVLHTSNGQRWEGDAIALACPAYVQAGLLASVDRRLADVVGGISYNRVAVVALGYRRADIPGRLDGFGYIVPQRTRQDVLGVQWCSAIFSDRVLPGLVLLRALCGGWNRPDVVGWEDERLLEAVRRELAATMSVRADPTFWRIVRWDRAIPQYLLGHGARVAEAERAAACHQGLFLAGNAYHGVALNDCTAESAALAIRMSVHLEAILAKDRSQNPRPPSGAVP